MRFEQQIPRNSIQMIADIMYFILTAVHACIDHP